MEYEANIHGIKIDKSKTSDKPDPHLFGDPESYKKMTKEERAKATKVMKGHHMKGFSKGL